MDNTPTQEELNQVVVEPTQELTNDTSASEEGTAQPEEKPESTETDKAKPESAEEDFFDKDAFEQLMKANPELAEAYKHGHKLMQASYTKKMQKLAQELKGKAELEEAANLYNKIASNGELVDLIDRYYRGELKPPENAGTTPQETPVFQQPAGEIKFPEEMPEEVKEFFRNPLNQAVINAMVEQRIKQYVEPIRNELKPLRETAQTARERNAYMALKETYPLLNVDDYWEDIMAVGRKNPALTWEQAFYQVIGPDLLQEAITMKNAGKEAEVKKQGFVSGGGKTTGQTTPAPDFSKMSAEEMAKYLPRHER